MVKDYKIFEAEVVKILKKFHLENLWYKFAKFLDRCQDSYYSVYNTNRRFPTKRNYLLWICKLDVTSRLTAKLLQSCQRKCIAVNGELPIVECEIPAVPQL